MCCACRDGHPVNIIILYLRVQTLSRSVSYLQHQQQYWPYLSTWFLLGVRVEGACLQSGTRWMYSVDLVHDQLPCILPRTSIMLLLYDIFLARSTCVCTKNILSQRFILLLYCCCFIEVFCLVVPSQVLHCKGTQTEAKWNREEVNSHFWYFISSLGVTIMIIICDNAWYR